ncbi:hypothetical protein LTR53_016902 [Teratosphaeriaceae sp. CCFEE 6253]|nr:hypothetical protein LTR53_016902 [Teratosphaeriaceae sp. CCFEE 6253]
MSACAEEMRGVYPPELCLRIDEAVARYPDLQLLFQDIARHAKAATSVSAPTNSKKRKLEDGVPAAASHYANGTTGTSAPAAISSPTIAFECRDVSFQVPARKKLRLQLVTDSHDNQKREVRLQNQQSNAIDYAIPADQIDQVFCLPVPEKPQRQWNFVLFPKPGAVTADGMPCEQMVFTMGEVAPTGATSTGQQITEQDTLVTVTERELNSLLQPQGKHVITPNAAEFASCIPQAQRKGEKAYHVKAYRGSKDGYLFFLPNGIVFGFKKPLAFFAFATIEAISYTSVLQRTFNLVITAHDDSASAEDTKDVEFSMLDQADFAGIDEYIKRHGLNDASMAAARRAKVHNVNKVKKESEANGNGEANGGAEGTDGLTELQRAEQQMQDAEDDEEEDYVESGGESDGEGEYSDDEDGEEFGEAGEQEVVEGVDDDEGTEEE